MDERRRALAEFLRHVAEEVETGRLEVFGEAPNVGIKHMEWSIPCNMQWTLDSFASVSAEMRIRPHCCTATSWFDAIAHAGKHLHDDPRGYTDNDE